MKNYNKILLVIIFFIIIYLIYLDYLCKNEVIEEEVILNNYNSKIENLLYNLNKKDRIVLKEFILSLTKEDTKRKQRKKLHNQIINGILVSGGVVALDNMEFPNYTLYPIAATLISILTPY